MPFFSKSWGYTCLVYSANLPTTSTSTIDPALFQPVSGDGTDQADSAGLPFAFLLLLLFKVVSLMSMWLYASASQLFPAVWLMMQTKTTRFIDHWGWQRLERFLGPKANKTQEPHQGHRVGRSVSRSICFLNVGRCAVVSMQVTILAARISHLSFFGFWRDEAFQGKTNNHKPEYRYGHCMCAFVWGLGRSVWPLIASSAVVVCIFVFFVPWQTWFSLCPDTYFTVTTTNSLEACKAACVEAAFTCKGPLGWTEMEVGGSGLPFPSSFASKATCSSTNPQVVLFPNDILKTPESFSSIPQGCLRHRRQLRPRIEFHVSGRCEIWTRPEGIGSTMTLEDYTCLRYAGSP